MRFNWVVLYFAAGDREGVSPLGAVFLVCGGLANHLDEERLHDHHLRHPVPLALDHLAPGAFTHFEIPGTKFWTRAGSSKEGKGAEAE